MSGIPAAPDARRRCRAGSAPVLLPPDAGLAVSAVTVTPDLIGIAARGERPTASCPHCGASSDRVHSRYIRTAADPPRQGRRVALRLTVRRFRCHTPGGDRASYCERFPGLLAPNARTTGRLTGAHRLIGFAPGGEPGARRAARRARPAGPDSLLRRARDTPLPARPAPRVLGADDAASRRGQNSGTIPVGLGRRCAIDLLPDRTADTLADWLRRRPGVTAISRDRASASAEGARGATPAATQVADRLPLPVNVRGAVEQVFARHPAAVRAAPAAGIDAVPTPPALAPEPPADRKVRASEGRRPWRRERYEQARRRREAGASLREVARALRMSRGALQRFLRTGHVPDRRPGRAGPSRLDPFRARLDRRVAGGCRGAKELFRELSGLGYAGGPDRARRAPHKRIGTDGRRRPRRATPGPLPGVAPRAEVPPPRRLSFAVIRRAGERGEAGQRLVERPRAAGAGVGAAVALAEELAALVRGRSAAGLEGWLGRAAASGLPELGTWARGIRQDEAAVRAGLTEAWSQGPVEGRVGRLTLIKRSMYGRAGLDLLKARALSAG
jgi:transposase